MEKFISIFAPSYSANANRKNNRGKFIQVFTGLTGYDIMLESSRKDLAPATHNTDKSTQRMSHLLSGSIINCLILFGRESCNIHK